MTRFRQALLSLAITIALLVPFAGAASADPGDPGTTSYSTSTYSPGWQGYAYGNRPQTATTTSDPGDPGTGP